MTREEAIDLLLNTSFFGRSMDDIDGAIDMAVEALKAEPKHGHWIEDYENVYECSECEAVVITDQFIPIEAHRFCRGCGAEMKC